MPLDVTLGWLFIVPLTALAVVVHATALRAIAELALSRGSPGRRHIALAVLAMLVAHTVEVWVFAGGLYLFDLISGTTGLRGVGFTGGFRDYLYFSTASYTSLGYGDVIAVGGARIVATFEALVGLLMIGWSSAFTFLLMQRMWEPDERG